LVGAGVNSVSDVKIALELGAQGFLVATAIVKAEDPEKVLRKFVGAF
jgi:thiazole synthase ThiGH ThiG subunit